MLSLTGIHKVPIVSCQFPNAVLDPAVRNVFSILRELEMIQETPILTSKVLSQVSMTVLQATMIAAVMSALLWPVSECLLCVL